MREPLGLTTGIILAIQGSLLARFGGLAGVRDAGLLESALARPQQLFAYGKPTLAELASSYALGIAKNHPFLDGNKRAAFMAAYTFLGANGFELNASEEEAVATRSGSLRAKSPNRIMRSGFIEIPKNSAEDLSPAHFSVLKKELPAREQRPEKVFDDFAFLV